MRKFTESLGRDIFEHEEELHDLLVAFNDIGMSLISRMIFYISQVEQ